MKRERMKMDKELTDKIDEGMFPELGGKEIEIGSGANKIKLHITESPIFYTKKLNKEMQPIYSAIVGVKGEVDVASLINVQSIESFLDTLINAAYTVVSRVAPKITKEQLEQLASEKDLIDIIKTQMEVNGIVNFFKDILAGVMNIAARMTTMSPKSEPSI